MSSGESPALGPSGIYELGPYRVARVGYGAMQLRRHSGDPEKAISILRKAIDLGVDHVDTADFYGDGFVNAVIGPIARKERHLTVVTKVGAASNAGGRIPIRPAQRPEQLRANIEDNLKSLGTDHLHVVNLRRLDVGPGLSAEGDQIVDIDAQLAEMIAMRDEGKIGAIGLSSVSMDNLNRALPAGIACVQNAYSLVSRHYEAMLDLCLANGIAWVPFFPLGGAHFPEWPKVTEDVRIIDIADRAGIAPSQLGLAWLLGHRPNVLLIPGTADIVHLEENTAAASIVLDQRTRSELDGIGAEQIKGEDQ